MAMTLDEAIEHAKEKGKGNDECAAEHRALAGFLEELRSYRQTMVLCIGENAAAKVGSMRLRRETEPHTVLTGRAKGTTGLPAHVERMFKPEGQIRVQDSTFDAVPDEPCSHRTRVWKNIKATCCFCDNEKLLDAARKAPERDANTICDNKLLIPAVLNGAVTTCTGCPLRSEEPAMCFYRSTEFETVRYTGLEPGVITREPGRCIVKCSHPEVLRLADIDPSGNWKGIQSAFPPCSVQLPFDLSDRTIQCEGCHFCTDTPLPR